MNKIIKRYVPVNELPKNWQDELPDQGHVDVQITIVDRPRDMEIASLVASARNVHGEEADIVAHVESLRDDR